MASHFTRLVRAYGRHGYQVRTGLNPYYMDNPDEGFTALVKDGELLSTGRGISFSETLFLEELLGLASNIKNVLVIGNAFGWSTLITAMCLPKAKVVAMDAMIEGQQVLEGKKLTHAIAAEEKLNVDVIDACSPADTMSTVNKHLGAEVDFVLIDGLHANPQLIKDFSEAIKFASSNCLFFCHDVLNWHLLEAINFVEESSRVHSVVILNRLSSGPAVAFCSSPTPEIAELVEMYHDATVNIPAYVFEHGGNIHHPGKLLGKRLARQYHNSMIEYVRATDNLSPQEMTDILSKWCQFYDSNPEVHFNAGACLIDHQLWQEALPYFLKVISLEPEWAEAYHHIGRIYVVSANDLMAKRYFEKAIAAKPNWYPPLFEHALLLAREGSFYSFQDWLQHEKPEKIIEVFSRLKRDFPQSVLAWEKWVASIDSPEKLNEAISCLIRLIDNEPRNGGARKALGLAHKKRGAITEAIDIFLSSVSEIPEWPGPGVLFEAAQCYLELNNSAQARDCLIRCLAIRPGYNEAELLLRECRLTTS